MAFVLHGDVGSGSATVELALAEIGVTAEVRDYPLGESRQRGEAYAAINPQRKLPALEFPDGSVLTESCAILLTLAERFPAAKLLPDAPDGRARALRWLLFMATELYPIIEICDYPERFQPEGGATPPARQEAIREHVRGIWKTRWLLVEQSASSGPWFLGNEFSLPDIYAAVLSRWAQVDDWRREHLPKIEAIAQRLATRPASGPVWRRHFG